MKKSIALLSGLALTSALIAEVAPAEPQPPHLFIKGGVWQLFGTNEEIDLGKTFAGKNVKVLWTWDNFEADGTNIPWKAYSTEFAMRQALEDGNFSVVNIIPPNQGFWVMSYEDIDVDIVPFNPIEFQFPANMPQDFFSVPQGELIDSSIKLFSKLGDELQVKVINEDSDIFTVNYDSDIFPAGTTAEGVDYNFSISGDNVGTGQFTLVITDIVVGKDGINDKNYTIEIPFKVDIFDDSNTETNTTAETNTTDTNTSS